MSRPIGSKNKAKARTGKPRRRCRMCRKRVYAGELGVIEVPANMLKTHYGHRVGWGGQTEKVEVCGECRQLELSIIGPQKGT